MNTNDNTPAPDYGEPWVDGFGLVFDYEHKAIIETNTLEQSARIIACVNALAGVHDPAAHLAAMREAIKTLVNLCERAMAVIQSDYPDTADMDDFVTDFDCTRQELQPFLK